eukprot:803968-Prorocentrum_minimum.AAC.1
MDQSDAGRVVTCRSLTWGEEMRTMDQIRCRKRGLTWGVRRRRGPRGARHRRHPRRSSQPQAPSPVHRGQEKLLVEK